MTRDWTPNPTGKGRVEKIRAAKFVAEVYADPAEFKTRQDWIAALDETLSDLARAFRMEPSVSLIDAIEELVA